MAEAAVDKSGSERFYCHQCSQEIRPNLPDFTCPHCQNGFIEPIANSQPSPSSSTSTSARPEVDPASQFAELWGQTFLQNFRNHYPERDEGASWARERDSDDEERNLETTRQRHRTFPGPRVAFRRTRPIRNQYVQGLLQYLVDRIGGEAGLVHGIPVNIIPLHSNPGDYAWGTGGLDTIITQLLNQLEGSGVPPADQEKIDMLPIVKIAQEHVDRTLQCSVCMEDFVLNEEVRRLPCDHHYHNDCIVPWLKLHGTCPVCRKNLIGEDTSLNPSAEAAIINDLVDTNSQPREPGNSNEPGQSDDMT
ncbi:hypothetical protein ACJMK2_043429 [Sinanodonta woodiana]|uniref:RING-type E3 ubiquitin transferase n=1 Tax=Sinanodonta woodiana TaxID=1069815 RepID=A0ABD3VWU2_SINWO